MSQGKSLDIAWMLVANPLTFFRSYFDGNGRGVGVPPYKRLPGVDIVQDLAHFPFKDASFDTVTLTGVLITFLSPCGMPNSLTLSAVSGQT